MGRPVPHAPGVQPKLLFVRTTGTVPVRRVSAPDEEEEEWWALNVLGSCTHENWEGGTITEALVSTRLPVEDVRIACKDSSAFVTRISLRGRDWVLESMAEARDEGTASLGRLATYVMQADEHELNVLQHPGGHDPNAVRVLLERCLDGLMAWGSALPEQH